MGYNPDNDFITCWFILYDEKESGLREIVAWSYNKDLAKYYMQIHHSKKLVLKKYSDLKKNLTEILNEHINEEIQIGVLKTFINGKVKILRVPLTQLDSTQIREFNGCFCEESIDYGLIYKTIPLLKKKYLKAFKIVLLDKIIEAVIFPKPNLPAAEIDIDELKLFHRVSPLF